MLNSPVGSICLISSKWQYQETMAKPSGHTSDNYCTRACAGNVSGQCFTMCNFSKHANEIKHLVLSVVASTIEVFKFALKWCCSSEIPAETSMNSMWAQAGSCVVPACKTYLMLVVSNAGFFSRAVSFLSNFNLNFTLLHYSERKKKLVLDTFIDICDKWIYLSIMSVCLSVCENTGLW